LHDCIFNITKILFVSTKFLVKVNYQKGALDFNTDVHKRLAKLKEAIEREFRKVNSKEIRIT